jgi:hypothetical protein
MYSHFASERTKGTKGKGTINYLFNLFNHNKFHVTLIYCFAFPLGFRIDAK